MKSNKGVSLVELIIAIAVLAMLMTAVGGLMSSNTIIFKKVKSDVEVSNTAQEVYNHIKDSILQANYVEVEGYTADKKLVFAPTDVGRDINVEPKREDAGATLTEIKLWKTDPADTAHPAPAWKDFSEVDADTLIYIKKLTIRYSVPLDATQCTTAPSAEVTKDQCTVVYTFEDNVMKVQKTYQYMDKANLPDDIYTRILNYVTVNSKSVSGAVMRIDAGNNGIALDMDFADKNKNMSYQSDGMLKIRNSYVLVNAK